MSMDVGGAKGKLKSDINVTPLVDVMLVLLIIMMLVAPMLQKGVDVKLPVAANTTDRRVYLNQVQVRDIDLASRVREILEDKTEKIVLIKADEDAPYASV